MQFSKALVVVVFLATVLIVHNANGKVLTRCQLVHELKKYTSTKPNFSNSLLPNWICLIEQESGRNTTKETPYPPPPNMSYGLFQINSKQWCRQTFVGGDCKVMCKDLVTDNIRKAVECANLIFQREGFKAWKGWVTHCKAKPENVPNIQNCKL